MLKCGDCGIPSLPRAAWSTPADTLRTAAPVPVPAPASNTRGTLAPRGVDRQHPKPCRAAAHLALIFNLMNNNRSDLSYQYAIRNTVAAC